MDSLVSEEQKLLLLVKNLNNIHLVKYLIKCDSPAACSSVGSCPEEDGAGACLVLLVSSVTPASAHAQLGC